MTDEAEKQAALSRYFRVIQVEMAEGLLASLLAIALGTVLGVIPAWISLLMVAAATLWVLVFWFVLRLFRSRGPTWQFKVEALNGFADRLTKWRRFSRPVILLEAALLVTLTILRWTGHLSAEVPVH